MNGYEDIIKLPRHISKTRARMERANRAAQFSPFAALTGYDAQISEAMRVTYPQFYLSTDMQEEINEKLVAVATRIDEQRCVELEYFVPDTRKSGGVYVTVRGVIKRFDEYERMIVMNDGKKIPIDSIRDVAF